MNARTEVNWLEKLAGSARYGRMIKEMDITLHPDPDTELDDERCTALPKWMAHRHARRVTLRMADVEVSVDAKVEAASELAPASPAENTAQPISMADFLRTVFAFTTPEPICVCSFPNLRDDPKQAGERHTITRSMAQIEQFVRKWDKPGRDLFVCVSTLQQGAHNRSKATVSKTVCLHADIDFKDLDTLGEDPRRYALRHLARLRYRPSVIVFSGGGLHVYWLLTEPLDTQTEMERIEAVLRRIADVVAGDLAVCEAARVMRTPGTHNTKNGQWIEAEVLELTDRRFEFTDVEEWLSEQSPVMLRKTREPAKSVGQADDWFDCFERYFEDHGFKSPIDVEARLKAMMYMGPGDSSIHQTQLALTASLLSRGEPIDRVVHYVLEATKRAAGEYGKRWNWRVEERNIRGMCETWLKKHPQPEVTVESAADVGAVSLDTKQDAQSGNSKTSGGGDTPAGTDNATSAQQDKTGSAALAELNAKYFVAKEGGKIWVITFEKERNRLIANYMRFSDFSNLYMNRLVQITDKDRNTQFVEPGRWWLKNRYRRQYDGLVFEPGNRETVIDNRFNLWRGWGVVPKRGNWKRMRQHIWKVLASGDRERFKYIMRWLAWTVQHPDQRAEAALVFKGKRGTGKGTLGNCMMVLFGQHSHQVSNSKHLTGNFNAHMRDVCFLFGDECYWPGEKQAEGTIKRMITEPTCLLKARAATASRCRISSTSCWRQMRIGLSRRARTSDGTS
jgi:hypothetical protein